MTARNFALVAAVIFAVIAVLQLMRAIFGWPVTVDLGWGIFHMPVWPNWIAMLVFGFLAWLGFAPAR